MSNKQIPQVKPDQNVDQKELNTLTLLGRMHSSLHTDEDLKRSLDLLSDHIIMSLKVKGCSVKVLNERRTRLEIFSIKGMSDDFLNNVGLYGMIRSPLNQAAIDGDGYYVPDTHKIQEVEIPQELMKEEIRSMASIPLKVEDQLFGVLSIYDEVPREFDDSEKVLLETLASLTAAVIRSLRKYQRGQNLVNLVKSLTMSLDMDDVLKEISIRATQSMKARASSIRLLNESTNQLVFETSYGLSKKYLEGIPKTLELSPIDTRVLEEKEVVLVEDMTKDPVIRMKEEASTEGLVTMICAPMTVKDKSIGILKLYYSASTKFTKEEINYLTTLAELSAVAVMNAQLYEKLHSLYQVTSSLSSTLESKRLLELISIHAADYMKSMGSNILLWDRVHEKFSVRTAYHLSKEFLETINFDRNSWSAQETLKGNPIIIGKIEEDDRLDIKEQCLANGIKAMVSIPMKIMGSVIGIMQIFCKQPRTFTTEEIQFLTALTNHGAMVLENAQMHEHFKNEYERLVDDIYVWHD